MIKILKKPVPKKEDAREVATKKIISKMRHESEEEQAKRAGFIPVSMGQRILRTETAGIVALAAIHTIWNQF